MSGVKAVDLSLFHNASLAKRTNITYTGGDVYIASHCPSDMSVLWGESFGGNERKFLRELMASQTICFSLKDTYQVHVQTVMRADSMTSNINMSTGSRRKGKFALLLHDLKGELTTSWTWAKFIRPLYRMGFSVVCVDLPGFGKSAVSQVVACPISAWSGQEAHVIAKIMEELSITKCQIMAVGKTCGMLLRVLQSQPHRLSCEHVLVNPIFDRNKLFDHVGIEPPPGAQAGWQEVIKEKQQKALVDLLRTTGVKLWCLFDREGMYRDQMNADSADSQNAYDSYQMLQLCAKNDILAANIKVTEITRNDLCEAQCGKRIPVRMFVPTRHLKASVARFMAAYERKPWQDMYRPNHILFQRQTGGSRPLSRQSDGVDDPFCDAIEDSPDEVAAKGPLGLPAKRALALMPRRTLRDMAVSKLSLPADVVYKEKKAEEKETKLNEEMMLQMIEETAKRDQEMEQKMRGSASAPSGGLGSQSRHSLSSASVVAGAMLKKSGAGSAPKIITAETLRDMKTMNWKKVPYEPNLSFGVRKMFLDAFEASVDTFKEEKEKEYKHLETERMRTRVL